MKVTVLMENTACEPQFAAEHGLSLYLETGKHKILFDTGATGAFADNARLLGVDLSQVDIAVLSHGHYDHGGGLTRFLELNDHAPVYLSRYAFGQYYNGIQKYIGLDRNLKENPRLVFTDQDMKLDEELALYSCNERPCSYPVDSAGLTECQNKAYRADLFLHEQYLVISEMGRKIAISGCSHKGILNIMEWLRPDILIGGFHFMKLEISRTGNARLDEAAEKLLEYDAKYYTCHCTGTAQYHYLKEKMGERLHALSAGQRVKI